MMPDLSVNQGTGTEADIASRIQQMSEPAPTEEAKPASDRENDTADQTEVDTEQGAEGESDEGNGNPAETEDADAETEDQDDQEPEYATVKINGKEEKVTKDELVKGYMQQADYSRKTADLAREREQVEAKAKEVSDAHEKRTKLVEELGVVESVLTKFFVPEQELQRLRQSDPNQYLLAKDANDKLQQQIQSLRNRTDQVTAEQQAAIAAEVEQTRVVEQKKLLASMPSLAKPETQTKFMDYARNMGYTDEQIASTLDHRIISAFEKARLYDDMQAKASKKPDYTVPKVVKGNAQRQSSREMNASKLDVATKQAKRTGSINDIAAVIAARASQR